MINDINKCGRKYECKHNNICEECFYKLDLISQKVVTAKKDVIQSVKILSKYLLVNDY